jgi:signal transduction histidine kinase
VVWGDAALLSEAVENLLGNAIKHAPEGSAVVCSIEREKRAVAISVADEGPGMTDAQLARAVRPFSGGTRRRGHGDSAHGFGLWIVRLIAERHGGSIELRNGAPGAVLTLRLPLDSSRNSEPTEP